MTSLPKSAAFVIAGAVIGFVASVVFGGNMLGGVYSTIAKDFSQGISVGTAGQFEIDADGDLSTSAEIDLTDPTFCIDFYATSTATALKMTASSTATIEGVDGVMVFAYGSC